MSLLSTFTTAVLFLTVQNVLVYTVGVVAAGGTDENRSLLDAAGEAFRFPLIYAVLAAVAVRLSGFSLALDSASCAPSSTIERARPLIRTRRPASVRSSS